MSSSNRPSSRSSPSTDSSTTAADDDPFLPLHQTSHATNTPDPNVPREETPQLTAESQPRRSSRTTTQTRIFQPGEVGGRGRSGLVTSRTPYLTAHTATPEAAPAPTQVQKQAENNTPIHTDPSTTWAIYTDGSFTPRVPEKNSETGGV